MKTVIFAFVYMGEREAVSYFEEYGYAKHAHFQDKQDRYSMRAPG